MHVLVPCNASQLKTFLVCDPVRHMLSVTRGKLRVCAFKVRATSCAMADASKPVSLPSRQWSCSELLKGAKVCADMAGMELSFNPNELSREQLVAAIKDSTEFTFAFSGCQDSCSSAQCTALSRRLKQPFLQQRLPFVCNVRM